MYQQIRKECKAIFMDDHEHNIAKDTGITIKQRIQTIQTIQHILNRHMPSQTKWTDQTTYNAVNYLDMMIKTFIHNNQWSCIYNNSSKQELYDFYIHHITEVIRQHICTI